MNIVALVGNLAPDTEIRTTESKKKVCTFRLAVSRSDGTTADFFTVVAWERQAEVCAEYLSVGRRVAIDGRLHHSTWQIESTDPDKKPERRSKVEVIAHRIEMLGAPKREEPDVDLAAEAGSDEAPVPEFAIT